MDLALKKVCFLGARPQALYIGIPTDNLSSCHLPLAMAIGMAIAIAMMITTCRLLFARVAILTTLCLHNQNIGPSSAFKIQNTRPWSTQLHSSSIETCEDCTRVYFDVAVAAPAGDVPLGRLVFRVTPSSHRHHLPLHASNFLGLASGRRKAVDPAATYEGCAFQFSPATIEDGSFRYSWGHVCDGYGRNSIRTTSALGAETSWDESFADPQRARECAHNCFGGTYYGQRYEEIADISTEDRGEAVVALTVPIQGPGSGTSKFSIVRVGESPIEWRERLLLNSAVVGCLVCGARGRFGGASVEDEEAAPTSLEVLRAMAQQRLGPPKIVNCGVAQLE